MSTPTNELSIRKLKDQFSESTRTVRRNLLIAASIGIILSAHTLKLTDSFGIDLKDSSTASIAVGAISIVAAYELLSFITYAVIDHMAWRLNSHSVIHITESDRLSEVINHTQNTMGQLNYIKRLFTDRPDTYVEAIREQSNIIDRICANAEQAINDYNNDIKKLRRMASTHNITQLFRIYVVDWGIPLTIGIICISRNWNLMGTFLSAALK